MKIGKQFSGMWAFVLVCVLLAACNMTKESNFTTVNTSALPQANGEVGEILVVIDTAMWRGEVGIALRKIFHKEVPGLSRAEGFFSLKPVAPYDMNRVLKLTKNLIYVTTMDSRSRGSKVVQGLFTEESLAQIKGNPALWQFSKQNEYAFDQELLFLFGRNETELLSNLGDNEEALRNHFKNIERRRLDRELMQDKGVPGISQRLLKAHDCFLKVPQGYELAHEEENFAWIRRLDPEADLSVVIHYEPYVDEGVFTMEAVMERRERIGKQFLFDVEKPQLHMTTQVYDEVPLLSVDAVNFKGKYATEARGLWKITDNSLGGPFLSYTFVDEELNRLYYIEGYVAAPGRDRKLPLIRELETVLLTFRTKAEYDAQRANTKS